ncbi:MAG: hypothetical protein ABSE98_08165, partial [Acidimicrobiales bacterium]
GAAGEGGASGAPAERGAAPAAPPEPAGRPAGDVGKRPSIGAVRRSQQAGGASPAPAPAASEPPAAEPAAPEPPAAAPATGAEFAAPADRDSLTEAWGDGILRTLPARAKALYSAGRFVAVDAQGAHFALPNTAHRDRCAELVPMVEAALAAHFGTPVTLVLDVDDVGPPAGGTPSRPVAPRGGGEPGRDAEVDDIDPAEFLDHTPDAGADQESAAEARLLEAFPGASEVAG